MAAIKRTRQERLSALEFRGGVLAGRAGRRLRLRDFGELGKLTAKAFVTFERIRWERGQEASAHQLLRAVSFAQAAMSYPEQITERLRGELRAMFSPTLPKQIGHRWQADKHPDALALFDELVRRGHL
ncbi:hypothetical protein AB4Y77_03595 [Paenarthrobacter sp. YAF11_1]|uniref:hypothetical protein n=1 Tax=Paenarthrobacter sp. YAF11_1 TaxID=3233074 RepID=UPI003F9C27CA